MRSISVFFFVTDGVTAISLKRIFPAQHFKTEEDAIQALVDDNKFSETFIILKEVFIEK